MGSSKGKGMRKAIGRKYEMNLEYISGVVRSGEGFDAVRNDVREDFNSPLCYSCLELIVDNEIVLSVRNKNGKDSYHLHVDCYNHLSEEAFSA